MLKHFFKLLFVRHPIERLISAYRNKFGEIESFQLRFGVDIVEKFRPKEKFRSGKGDDVSFIEFAQFLDSRKNVSREFWNEHWSPVKNLCQPCNVHYHAVGEYQNLHKESNEILRHLGTSVEYPLRQAWYHPTTSNHVTYFFSLLNSTLRESVNFLYKDDFRIFNYERLENLSPLDQNSIFHFKSIFKKDLFSRIKQTDG